MSDMEEHDERVFRLTRRKALKGLALGIGTMVLPAKDASASVWESFFQKHFRELGRLERQKILARLEEEYSAQYKKSVRVKDTPPPEGGLFGDALDLSRCVGGRGGGFGRVAGAHTR